MYVIFSERINEKIGKSWFLEHYNNNFSTRSKCDIQKWELRKQIFFNPFKFYYISILNLIEFNKIKFAEFERKRIFAEYIYFKIVKY